MRWLEPRRLEGAASEAPELARAIRELRGMDGGAAEVESLRARLEQSLPGAPTGAGPGGGASSGGLAVKGGLTLLALALAFVGWRGLSERTQVAAPRVEPAPQVAAPRPDVADSPLSALPPVEARDTEPSRPPQEPKHLRTRAPAASAAADPPRSPEDELALIGRAQAALDRRPDRTLALVAEHARDYPAGVFSQEREVLWMEAKLKLGHRAEVYPRAERFLARYPRSTHAPRVRALLQAHGVSIEQQDPAAAATHGHAQER